MYIGSLCFDIQELNVKRVFFEFLLILAAFIAVRGYYQSKVDALENEVIKLQSDYIKLSNTYLQENGVNNGTVMVAEGGFLVDETPVLSSGDVAMFDAMSPLTGTWNGIKWQLEVKAGDIVHFSEKEPGKLLADVYTYDNAIKKIVKIEKLVAQIEK